ncbi:hypothetical protein NDN08_004602 [Rhodosorus marinus]|uniref:Centrosomal protein of 70 kDa n=1 Tax=Rhodosorus marinus TaxID=101924 RepID=A0AAV8UPS2_9RHOD|nr:hypothetical protein NDN08_004602 [Rhodosorus marinus]
MASDRFQDIDELHRYLSASLPPQNKENRCSNSDIDMVNRLLEANGFAGSLEPLKQGNMEETFNSTLASISKVVHRYKTNEERLGKVAQKIESVKEMEGKLSAEVRRGRGQLESKKRKLVDLQNTIREEVESFKSASAAVKRETNELRSFNSSLLQRETKNRMEMKRKEVELEKTRESLRALTSREGPRARGPRKVARGWEQPAKKKADGDSYFETFLVGLNERQELLIRENEEIRAQLAEAYEKLMRNLPEQDHDNQDELDNVSVSWFQMPLSLIYDELETMLNQIERQLDLADESPKCLLLS